MYTIYDTTQMGLILYNILYTPTYIITHVLFILYACYNCMICILINKIPLNFALK